MKSPHPSGNWTFAFLLMGLLASAAFILGKGNTGSGSSWDLEPVEPEAQGATSQEPAAVLREEDPSPPTTQDSQPNSDEPTKPESEDAFLRDLELFNITDKPRALALTEAGERWYEDVGVAAEARRAMRITLLVDLERMVEARRLVGEYLQKYPNSRYLPLVQGVTGIHPRPEPSRDLP